MTNQIEFDLLVDISKLLKKYGPETFKSLADLLSSQEPIQNAIDILRGSVNITRKAGEIRDKKESAQTTELPKSLINIMDSEPEKYQLLVGLNKNLIEKVFLPSLRDVKYFAVDSGLQEIRSKSRKEAIRTLMNSLAKLPQDILSEKLQNMKRYGTSDRSLQGWTDIILNKSDVKHETHIPSPLTGEGQDGGESK